MKDRNYQNIEMLKELIQNAISEYVYETGDNNFSALVRVEVRNGWSKMPEIKQYGNLEE